MFYVAFLSDKEETKKHRQVIDLSQLTQKWNVWNLKFDFLFIFNYFGSSLFSKESNMDLIT